MTGAVVGVDVGGTFTDLAAVVEGRIVSAKVPTTPDQSDGVIQSVEVAQIAAADVAHFGHGTTVVTNALLERKGAKTALITTDGFRDIIEIARQNRPSLYDLTLDRPPPLVERELRFTVRERMAPEGEITPLDDADIARVIEQLRDAGIDAVAVCLLFSYLHPDHEEAIARRVREAIPDVHLSVSSEVVPEFREYERFATTVADAYLGPKLTAYLQRLAERSRHAGLPEPLVMQSSGGVIDATAASTRAAACVLSGPAAGVVGAAFVAAAARHDDVLTFDMGGTSTDVAAVIGGEAHATTDGNVGGVPLKLPMVDVHTVGAGGGSIGWIDEGGALRVGPHSAGAQPGPASYGLGGTDSTVTDANLLLGYLAEGVVLGGSITLDRDLAESSLATLGHGLGLDTTETALGVVRVADAEMARALRVISVERGLDPREFALVAFGGAGPMHACALAEELEIPIVLVPITSGVLSALGLAISDVRRDYVAPFHASRIDPSGMQPVLDELKRRATEEVPDAQVRMRADLRYPGQSFELTIDIDDLSELANEFHRAHKARYGYDMPEESVQIVNLRATASRSRPRPQMTAPRDSDGPPTTRPACFEGDWLETKVWSRGSLGATSRLEGPAIVELDGSTCVVRPGWSGEIDPSGTLVLER